MDKYIAEFIGTFFLVLTVGCTVIGDGAGALAPLAIGSALMVMIFAAGHISGGHFNPAVTLGVWLRGKFDAKDVTPYMVSQVSGAVVAALCRKVFERGKCRYSAPTDDTSGTCRGVSLHLCPGLRCAEHRYSKGHIRAIPFMGWPSASRCWWEHFRSATSLVVRSTRLWLWASPVSGYRHGKIFGSILSRILLAVPWRRAPSRQ